MNMRLRYVLLGLVYLAGVVSCLVWGTGRTWVVGLGISLVSLATLATAYVTDVGESDKRRFTVGGAVFLVFGLGLLVIGLRNP
ncbi:MAG TPA: hypothetical protein VLD63_08880 [Anaerolineales bacterium]|nr:hypothetical protein [Anaerolineales bacterium]